MPEQRGPVIPMEMIPVSERPDLCTSYQIHWYSLVAERIKGCRVLDVGAGAGSGMHILWDGGAVEVVGMDPTPAGPGIRKGVLGYDIGYRSWDWVVAVDVIEHVPNDHLFLDHMLRTARKAVFFSTPNWDRFHCENPHHLREYTPAELRSMLEGTNYELWTVDDVPCKPIKCGSWDDVMSNFGVFIFHPWINLEIPIR